jgi:hypothetical integral membrane protein (TIGR02206 family)
MGSTRWCWCVRDKTLRDNSPTAMNGSPHLYGLFHLAWLTGIAGTSIALSSLCRRGLLRDQYVRAVLVCLLVAGELQHYFKDGLGFPHHLPLNLCNITTWVAVFACLGLYPVAVEFTYFAGLAGAGMALITPDMGSEWPVRFFMNHGALIVAASVLVFGRIAPLGEGALWRASACTLFYLAFIGVFDWAFKTNYAYLRKKPGASTLLSVLGQWPYYILGMIAAAFLIYWLLWLPVRPRKSKRGSIPVAEHSEASA